MIFFDYLNDVSNGEPIFRNNSSFSILKNKYLKIKSADKFYILGEFHNISPLNRDFIYETNHMHKRFIISKYDGIKIYASSNGQHDYICYTDNKGIFFFKGLRYIISDILSFKINLERRIVDINIKSQELNTGAYIEEFKTLRVGLKEFSNIMSYIGLLNNNLENLDTLYLKFIEKKYGLII